MRGPWIQTYTGEHFYLLDPKPEEIHLEDIAVALANICRFTGHIEEAYSVAQHSVLCAENVQRKYRKEALLHDAAEAYISDLSHPLKHCAALKGYRKIEEKIEAAIAERFGLTFPFPAEIKVVDNRIFFTEQRDLRKLTTDDWMITGEPFEFHLKAWTPKRARKEFLKKALELGIQ